MKRLLILTLVFCTCAVCLNAQKYRIRYSSDDKDPIEIENAIRLALENNYQLLLTEQDVIIAQQRLQEAKFLYLPQVSVNAAATSYKLDYPSILPESLGLRYLNSTDSSEMFYGLGVQATQYLYTGGRTSSTVSLANATVKEAMSRYEAVKSSVIFEVKKAFFEYLFLQRKKLILEDIRLKAQKAVSRTHYKTWEKILVKSEMARLDSMVNQTDEELSNANLKLLSVLNKEINSKIVIQGDFDYEPVEVNLAQAKLWAMEFRPELKSALYKLEMDNIAVKLSLAKRYPDVILGVGYERLGQDTLSNENIQATLALKLPIGYDYGTQIKQKRAEQRQTILKQAAIEDSIRLQVTEAYNNLQFWQNEAPVRIATWDTINKELGDITKGDFSKEELFKVLDYYYNSGVNYLEGIKQHMLAKARLELAVGQDLNN